MRRVTTLPQLGCGALKQRTWIQPLHKHKDLRTSSRCTHLSTRISILWKLRWWSRSVPSRSFTGMTHTQHGLSSCTVGPNADAYSYEPLLDEDQIRILTLHPSTDPDAPLTGELGVESLDLTTDHYDAISYVWGDPTRTHGLQIPTASISPPHLVNLPLTRSVHDALHRLRLPNQPRRLWADQVCINQDDVAERSRQVRLMNRIYRGASEVLVWLGPDDEGVAPGAFRIVRELEEVFGNEEKMEVFRREHLEELAERNAEAWKPLSRLTKLPWFNRIWIVQEIGTAAPATLYWGKSASLTWTTLSFVSSILSQDFHHLRARFQIYTPNITYLHFRFVRLDPSDEAQTLRRADSTLSYTGSVHNRSCFVYELHRARHLLAKDPRDRVYAFLGHFSLRETGDALAHLVPDYSLPVDKVYIDVAVRALRGPSALRVLSACQATETKTRPVLPSPDLALPSWVPDWRATPIHIINTPVTPHRAAGETTPMLEIDEEGRRLHICGERIDTIAKFSWEFFSHTFEMRKGREGKSGAVGAKMLPLEALWQHICGFDTEHFALEARYQNDCGEGHENSALFALVQTLTNGCIGLDRSRPYHSIPPTEWLSHAASYLTYQLPSFNRPVSQALVELAQNGDAFRWSREATLVSRYRRFAVTSSKGYYILGPEALREGDAIVVLRGGRTPFVLRGTGEGRWRLLGECYVHGIMNGEGFGDEAREEEWFTIV